MNADLGCEPLDLPKPERFYFRHPKKDFKSLKERLADLENKTPVSDGISWVFKSLFFGEIIARLLIQWQAKNRWDGIDESRFLESVYQEPSPGDRSILYRLSYSEVSAHLAALYSEKDNRFQKRKEPSFLRRDGNLIYPTKKLVDELKKLPKV